jgi:putative flavoprotein involved in K+ transport
VAVDGERVSFDDSAAANVAAGDAFAARARAMADGVISRQGRNAPPAEPDEHDLPVELDPPAALDLRAEEVGGVVWCTGFSGDFSWLEAALVGPGGLPRHSDGVAPAPGLWYLGLRWMRRRGSSILYGFRGDAAWVAGEVGTHLGG